MPHHFYSSVMILSLTLTPAALAVDRYFPSPPGDDEGENTVDYDIGTFGKVVVGFEPDPTAPNSTPYPYTKPATTTLNVQDGGVIGCTTYIYNGSILNVTGGKMQDIWASYDPAIDGGLAGDSATIRISNGIVGSVFGYGNDTIGITGGSALAVSASGAASIFMSGGQVQAMSAVLGATASVSGGEIKYDVLAGTNNEAVSDHTGIVVINQATVGGSISAVGNGHMILDAGTVGGGGFATENGALDLNGGTLNGDLYATKAGIITLGTAKIGGSASLIGTATLIGGASGASIAKGITTADQASVALTTVQINGQLYLGGTSNTVLTGCSVAVNNDAAIITISSSTLTLGGASTVTGDVYANDTSTITLQGSVITGNVYAAGGTINMKGGIINGHVTLLGGIFNYSGGIVTQNVSGMMTALAKAATTVDSSADSLGFTIQDGGVLNIFGTGFTYQLIDANYLGQYSEYALTGYLADGTYINDGTFLVLNNSNSTFALLPPVPEPATAALILPAALLLFRRRSS